ncbi:hypothetical protein GCT13_44150 [Paraburkholderia sp. CNPSo 3157]|uniref:Uncharacterized protein n=1 Tax=Paraburkholderia franconis TaxID=2654983 RepID=A0A7X1TLK0_9BURK|nr:hypothetical protein [Paraburkholderia franconis]MPW23534.1 hypothetical protein [Paraburkholderia franconis]
MKKLTLGVVLFSIVATALAAFFFSAVANVLDNGTLAVAFDERGLGNTNVNYTLTGSATAVFACFNGGGNHPQSTNKAGPSAVSVNLLNQNPKNGRIQAAIIRQPPDQGA